MELRFKEENDNWEVTISPGEALLLMSYLAGKLACSQTIPVKFTTTQFKPSQPTTPILDATTIQELKLRRDHEMALEDNGIKYLSDLVSKTERTSPSLRYPRPLPITSFVIKCVQCGSHKISESNNLYVCKHCGWVFLIATTWDGKELQVDYLDVAEEADVLNNYKR
jgi:hypothetical protein